MLGCGTGQCWSYPPPSQWLACLRRVYVDILRCGTGQCWSYPPPSQWLACLRRVYVDILRCGTGQCWSYPPPSKWLACFALQLIHKNNNNNKSFIIIQTAMLDFPVGNEVCIHVDRNHLDDPIPFKIMYTNMILNGRGSPICWWSTAVSFHFFNPL